MENDALKIVCARVVVGRVRERATQANEQEYRKRTMIYTQLLVCKGTIQNKIPTAHKLIKRPIIQWTD